MRGPRYDSNSTPYALPATLTLTLTLALALALPLALTLTLALALAVILTLTLTRSLPASQILEKTESDLSGHL